MCYCLAPHIPSLTDRSEGATGTSLPWGGGGGGGVGGEGAGLRWRLSASLQTLSGGGAAGVWVLGKRRTGSEGNSEKRKFADVRKQEVKKKKEK